jgi:transposase InsO family protein
LRIDTLICRKTRKQYLAEEKPLIVVLGLRGEERIAALCCKESIAEGLYYSWSKEFLEAGKRCLAGDNRRQSISGDHADWLEDHAMKHGRGAPYHPQTQGKVERWYQI